MDKSLLDEDADNVLVLLVQNPHDVSYREPVIDEEIAYGDFPFYHRVQRCRIPRARKHFCGETEAVSFQRFGEYHGGLSLSLAESGKTNRKNLESGGRPA